jgi:hypothetical protein
VKIICIHQHNIFVIELIFLPLFANFFFYNLHLLVVGFLSSRAIPQGQRCLNYLSLQSAMVFVICLDILRSQMPRAFHCKKSCNQEWKKRIREFWGSESSISEALITESIIGFICLGQTVT